MKCDRMIPCASCTRFGRTAKCVFDLSDEDREAKSHLDDNVLLRKKIELLEAEVQRYKGMDFTLVSLSVVQALAG